VAFSFDVIPQEADIRCVEGTEDPHLHSEYRGDTLRLRVQGERPTHVFATTRGARHGSRGWLSIFELGENGMFEGEERWETPTSGGKANAIELLNMGKGRFCL
jgi:carboxy-cis,cis-muconate cyclase